MQIRYMNDLSYYYLGHAAENVGYLPAAQRYYRIAERLPTPSSTQNSSPASASNPVPSTTGFVEPAPATAPNSPDFFEPPPVRR
jgi:hypothetical protein